MALWRRFWLLFSAIWVLVAGLNAATLLFFDDEPDKQKILVVTAIGIGVPAAAYLLGWLLERWRQRR